MIRINNDNNLRYINYDTLEHNYISRPGRISLSSAFDIRNIRQNYGTIKPQ